MTAEQTDDAGKFDDGWGFRFTRRMLLLVIAALLGIVEGLTEFLPISSTGHLVIFDQWFGFEKMMGKSRADAFEIFIQRQVGNPIAATAQQRLDFIPMQDIPLGQNVSILFLIHN